MELELADEDEPILYKIASSFYHLKPEQASERVTRSLEELDSSIESLTEEADGCKEQMDSLKEVLYKKFGSESGLLVLICVSVSGRALANVSTIPTSPRRHQP